jgi:hypothetical protein
MTQGVECAYSSGVGLRRIPAMATYVSRRRSRYALHRTPLPSLISVLPALGPTDEIRLTYPRTPQTPHPNTPNTPNTRDVGRASIPVRVPETSDGVVPGEVCRSGLHPRRECCEGIRDEARTFGPGARREPTIETAGELRGYLGCTREGCWHPTPQVSASFYQRQFAIPGLLASSARYCDVPVS